MNKVRIEDLKERKVGKKDRMKETERKEEHNTKQKRKNRLRK